MSSPDPSEREAALARLVDPAFYLERNPDVARAGLDPVRHFLATARTERRHCHPLFQYLLGRGFAQGLLSSTDAVLDVVPPGIVEAAAEPVWWRRLTEVFQPGFYLAQAEGRGLDAKAIGDPILHFLLEGAREGFRPTLLFDRRVYLAAAEAAGLPRLDLADRHPFLHWHTFGREARVVPTALFDETWYLAAHPDVAAFDGWSFEHYYRFGVAEPRQPSQVFDSAFFRRQAPEVRFREHMVDHAVVWPTTAPAPGLLLREAPTDLSDDTPLEAYARRVSSTFARLETSPVLREAVERAGAMEPLIFRPAGPRRLTLPPFRHDQNLVRRAVEDVLEAFGRQACDGVILIPHCRVGGAARVAGAFHQALATACPEMRLVVATTESDEFQRPDWFEGARLVDISGPLSGVSDSLRRQALAHSVRAMACRTVVTVNSRLGWGLAETYGAQLSTEMRLAAYLFTYDLSRDGRKVGYPIAPLQAAFDNLDLVMVDNTALKTETVNRYLMPKVSADRIQVLYTPAEPSPLDLSEIDQRPDRPQRLIWAGRFDRQKRFDLVVELARAWPEIEIWAWGKAVIGDFDLSLEALPSNIVLKGEFEAFDDLPLREADLLLYTSEWDGLPTLLIDAGLRGMTVVASRAGGVGELIDETTGWPVDPPTDPGALRAAVEAALADPHEARRRARALRERTMVLTDPAAYVERIRALFPELAQP